MANVVGHLTWRDFVNELKIQRPQVVRVQTYHKLEGGRPPVRRFWAEVAFASGNEVHVAKLSLGTVYDFEIQRDPDVQAQFRELMDQAEAILHGALTDLGLEVRRGVYAKTERFEIVTNPSGLWRIEHPKQGRGVPRLIPDFDPDLSEKMESL